MACGSTAGSQAILYDTSTVVAPLLYQFNEANVPLLPRAHKKQIDNYEPKYFSPFQRGKGCTKTPSPPHYAT